MKWKVKLEVEVDSDALPPYEVDASLLDALHHLCVRQGLYRPDLSVDTSKITWQFGREALEAIH